MTELGNADHFARSCVVVHAYSAETLYCDTFEFEFDHIVLAHLKVIVTQKLWKREPFFVNWRRSVTLVSERMSMWVTPNVPISSSAFEIAQGELREDWIDEMTDAADTANGDDALGMPKDGPHRGSQRREGFQAKPCGRVCISTKRCSRQHSRMVLKSHGGIVPLVGAVEGPFRS